MEKEGVGLEITELRLGLPGGDSSSSEKNKKRVFAEIDEENSSSSEDGKTERKNQVVGWPPVCSYRKKNSNRHVKVSMDGAPFLRKIDLAMHKGYSELGFALEKLFGSSSDDKCEQLPIYEDKDGDWMLVGDVPWQMFIESCKRLRIMKRSDAKGFVCNQKNH